MAATVIVFIFFGMIQAVTIGTEMMATARRQTLASKILDHELEQLRLVPWATINALPAGPTDVTPTSAHPFFAAIQGSRTIFTVSRSVTNVSGLSNVREVTFTVTWTVQPSGGVAPRTYTRMKSGYYGKYGLNLSLQRS